MFYSNIINIFNNIKRLLIGHNSDNVLLTSMLSLDRRIELEIGDFKNANALKVLYAVIYSFYRHLVEAIW